MKLPKYAWFILLTCSYALLAYETQWNVYVILLLFALIMAIAVIVLNEDYIIVFALVGLVLTVLARFLPGMVIRHYLNGTIGSSFEMDVLQFGAGWWIMLAGFAAATIGGFIAKKQMNSHE